MTGDAPDRRAEPGPLALAGWFRTAAGVLAVLALVAVVVDGVVNGLSFGLMVRWTGLLIAALVLLAGVAAAVSAVRGAAAAGRRGDSLSEGDVGLLPPRRRD
jgi:hypothetical protein